MAKWLKLTGNHVGSTENGSKWDGLPVLNEATRKIYVKGPGMIFKGNPKNYLTEIQLSF